MFEAIGTTGSLILCASAIPQVIKTFRTKKAHDLSMAYLLILMTGLLLLQVYCVHTRDFVFILGNTLSLITTGILIILRFRYGMLQVPCKQHVTGKV